MLEVHEAANIFPMMTDEELNGLADDIKQNGQRESVLLYHGKVIDGRNRLKACEMAGVKPHTRDATNEVGESPAAFVLSLNLHRRHLNESQRAMVGARAKWLFEAEAKARQVRKPGSVSANLRGQNREHKAAHDAAALVSVGARTVEHAAKVLREAAPEVVRAVEQGKIAVSAAAKIAAKAPEQQAEIVRRVASGEAKNVIQAARAVDLEERVANAPKSTGPDAKVITGDAVSLFASWSGPKAAAMVTDPPYGIDVHTTRKGGKDYADGEDYALRLLADVCEASAGALTQDAHIYVFCGYTHAWRFREILSAHFHVQENPIIWEKNNHTMCDFSQWYPNRHEYVWFGRIKGSRRPLAACVPDVISCARQNDTQHSAEKPTALLRRFIEQSTAPGETILDPFTGSGATGVAALACGRKFVGFELDEKWANVARSRMS